MASVRSAGERIPVSTVSEHRPHDDHKPEVFDYGIGVSTQRGINDLQTGPENYPDYPDYPSSSVSSKYRTSGQQLPNRQRYYRPGADEDGARLTDNPKIHVHTIGDDRKNDRRILSGNEFQASYAPTVPTVTTTSRRFYSPTIPTTQRSSTRSRASSGYDLEVESSDHLYTARGRSDETVKAATPPTVLVKNVSTPEISLPILVNSAMEENGGQQQQHVVQSAKSSRGNSTFRDFTTNLTTKVESSTTEETFGKNGGAYEDNTEDLAIFTINEENRDPRIFSYSRDDEETNSNIESSSAPETMVILAGTSGLGSVSGEVRLTQILEPPQKLGNDFRIMVPDKSAATIDPRIVEDADSDEKSLKNANSKFAGSVLIDVPASHVTPPWSVVEKESRESRIIRIFINNNETSGRNSSSSILSRNSVERSDEIATSRPVRVNNFAISIDNEESTLNLTTTLDPVETSSTFPRFSDQKRADVNTVGVSVANEQYHFDVTTIHAPVSTSSITFEDERIKDDDELSLSGKATTEKKETAVDSTNAASSPFQVTLTVDKSEELDRNGDVIRRLIVEENKGRSISSGAHGNFEIFRSKERGEPFVQSPRDRVIFSKDPGDPRNERRVNDQREGTKIREEKSHDYDDANGFKPSEYGNIVALLNGPNAPRPFSLGTQRNLGNMEVRKTSTDLGDGEPSTSSPLIAFGTSRNEILTVTARIPSHTTRHSTVSSFQDEPLEKSSSTTEVALAEDDSEQSRRSFGELKTVEQKNIFELPHRERSLDFVTGSSLRDAKKSTTSNGEDTNYSMVSEKSAEKLYARTIVETEVIPSLGFSLNTEEGREEFMEAVMKGLLQYVPDTENTKNTTETSTES